MPVDCSCDVITHAQYREAARKLADQVGVAPSFGSAVGVIFRDTHPERQTEPAEIFMKRRCQTCTPHIGRALVEEGLRSQEEFDNWQKRFRDKMTKCKDCPKVAACAAGFDFSPL